MHPIIPTLHPLSVLCLPHHPLLPDQHPHYLFNFLHHSHLSPYSLSHDHWCLRHFCQLSHAQSRLSYTPHHHLKKQASVWSSTHPSYVVLLVRVKISDTSSSLMVISWSVVVVLIRDLWSIFISFTHYLIYDNSQNIWLVAFGRGQWWPGCSHAHLGRRCRNFRASNWFARSASDVTAKCI